MPSAGSSGSGPAATSSGRNPRACENCRARRIKCSGRQPCEACVAVGVGEGCQTRIKSRPNRLPRVAVESAIDARVAPTWRSANFVGSVEKDVERWAEGKGIILSAALSDAFPVRDASLPMAAVSSTLPSQPDNETALVHSCLPVLPYFDFIHSDTLLELLTTYHAEREALDPPSMALLFASFCIGSFSRSKTDPGLHIAGDAIEWFRRTLLVLDGWDGVSLTALIALHLLHMFTTQAGGILETRDVLKRMANMVHKAELHRSLDGEEVSKLPFSTIYKDSWFATICDSPPFLNVVDISLRMSRQAETPQDLDRGPVYVPVLMQLTEFENDLMTKLHRAPLSNGLTAGYISQLDGRWSVWLKEFKEEQARMAGPMLYVYATIRFHWLRCLLHYSLLHSPPYSASSQALLARSVSHIIRGYAKCATDHRYTPSWPDLRRITTCGHLVLLLHDAEEYVRDEAEDLLSFVLKLVAGLKGNCPMAMDALTMLTRLMRLADFETSDALPVDPSVPQPPVAPFLFDYSFPPLSNDWSLDSTFASILDGSYEQ